MTKKRSVLRITSAKQKANVNMRLLTLGRHVKGSMNAATAERKRSRAGGTKHGIARTRPMKDDFLVGNRTWDILFLVGPLNLNPKVCVPC